VGRVCGVAPKLRRCRATTTLLNNLSPSSTRRPAGSEVRILRTILSHDTITTHQTGGDPTHWGVAAHLAMFGIFGRSVGTSPSARERPRERSLAARDPTITDLVHGDTITEPRLNWYFAELVYLGKQQTMRCNKRNNHKHLSSTRRSCTREAESRTKPDPTYYLSLRQTLTPC
jgi:hypothetical protein